MARLVVTKKDVGTVAHWCVPCASLQPVALEHEFLEGRVYYVVSVGGAQVIAAIGRCLRCGDSKGVAPGRFPTASRAARPIQDFDGLIAETNHAVAAQRARLDALRTRTLPADTLSALSKLLGHPRAETLLGLAEANASDLSSQMESARRGVDIDARCHELARSIAATYPASAGLALGFFSFSAVLALPYALNAPVWSWVLAVVAGGAVARVVIGQVRGRRVGEFVARALTPALARDGIDASSFLASIARYRSGGPGSIPALQDMANDHELLAHLLSDRTAPVESAAAENQDVI